MSGRAELTHIENGRPGAAVCGRRHRTDPSCPECARIVRAIERRRNPPPAKPEARLKAMALPPWVNNDSTERVLSDEDA